MTATPDALRLRYRDDDGGALRLVELRVRCMPRVLWWHDHIDGDPDVLRADIVDVRDMLATRATFDALAPLLCGKRDTGASWRRMINALQQRPPTWYAAELHDVARRWRQVDPRAARALLDSARFAPAVPPPYVTLPGGAPDAPWSLAHEAYLDGVIWRYERTGWRW